MLVAVAALCLSVVHAQEGEEEPQQVTLNREKLEQLMSFMSPACRVEMESALTAQTQMSNECREEVQVAFKKLGVDLQAAANGGREGSPAEPAAEDSQPQENSRRSERRAQQGDAGSKGDSTSTILAIVGFVTALLGGAAAYVFYVSSQQDASSAAKKPKKLSKRKVGEQH
ncbi:hypothetical protein EON64_10445 [archaeon]|nr:MAG: hypothetical protein EON64_10445 [archaeon]